MFNTGDKVKIMLNVPLQAYLSDWSLRFIYSNEIGIVSNIQKERFVFGVLTPSILINFGSWTLPLDLLTASTVLEKVC